MNKRLALLIGTGTAVLLLTAVLATSAFAQGTTPYGQRGMMGGGMMGGRHDGGRPLHGPQHRHHQHATVWKLWWHDGGRARRA